MKRIIFQAVLFTSLFILAPVVHAADFQMTIQPSGVTLGSPEQHHSCRDSIYGELVHTYVKLDRHFYSGGLSGDKADRIRSKLDEVSDQAMHIEDASQDEQSRSRTYHELRERLERINHWISERRDERWDHQ